MKVYHWTFRTLISSAIRRARPRWSLAVLDRRWEFMRMPNEFIEDLQKPEKVWELLSPWLKPEDATLVRHAVYKFR
ncbi:hypothetical protein LMG28138_05867 [Pararobbsia alpina]|uniref:Uncharacterized protein n=1 Tax=Pararobbsia alpina TaxID=621374 RepID=A0A6S7BXD4_9BURK|nr:hypothetical protein LMG28138_05867 [Pararobbsia alpina]